MVKKISSVKVFFDDENNRLIFCYDGDNSLADIATSKADVSIFCKVFGDHLLEVLGDEHDFEFED